MKETEITVQVFNSFEEIDKILKEQGFARVENFQINDWYFSKINNVKRLKYVDLMDNSFLVRQILSFSEEVQICYKKKNLDSLGNVVSEEKFTTKVDSLKTTLNIFKNSKLNNYCKIENNTFVYQKKDVCFAVQVVKDLGIFIEYEENESIKNMKANEKIEQLKATIQSLNLNLGKDFSCKKIFMRLHK